jgi:NAD(P)-dependent dehydrogenase (short-subunit alcohol dehydrogenase family)
MVGRLENKVAIITGGAGGIGAATILLHAQLPAVYDAHRAAAIANVDDHRLALAGQSRGRAHLVTYCRQANDCDCTMHLAVDLVVETLSDEARPPRRDVISAVTDLLRLAFGPGRAVFVEVRSPDYPTRFPMERRC